MRALISANTDALNQVLTLIQAVPDTVYQSAPEGMTSSIGRHVRHVLDHYTAFQTGIESGEVDYDMRSRDSAVENDASLAEKNITAVIAWIKSKITQDKPIQMKTEVSVNCKECVVITSSLQRELIYLLNHTLHHAAYVSLMLRKLGVNIDNSIGVAPATQSYLRSDSLKEVG